MVIEQGNPKTWTKTLDQITLMVLEERLGELEPDNFGEDWADWEPVKAAIEAVLADPTIGNLRAHPLAMEELDQKLSQDWLRTENCRNLNADGKRVEADLLRAAGEVYTDDPMTYRSRRPRTRVVDGVRFICE